MEEGFLQLRFGTSDQSPIHAADPVVADVLDDLSIDAKEAEHPGDRPFVQVQTVGGEQKTLSELSWFEALTEDSTDVPCSAATDHH